MRNQSTFGSVVLGIIGALVLIVVLSAILAFPVMLLWNGALVPVLSAVTKVTFLQAWGISILAGLLFKSTGTSSSD